MKIISDYWRNTRSYIKRNERMLFPAFLIVGFIVDSLTITRVDKIFDNIIVLIYIILAGGSILIINMRIGESTESPFLYKIKTFMPLVMQYAFGGLFSAMIIFYSKSTSLLTSGPFLIALIILFIGNDKFHSKYPRLLFQIAVFYIAVLSYCLLIVPVLVGQISTAVFVLGTIVSATVMLGYFVLLAKLLPENFTKQINNLYYTTGGILCIFYILYFLNIIPPIPLSLKDSGIYHSVTRTTAGEYHVTLERPHWYEFYRENSRTFHRTNGESVYAFSAVFAPTRINGTIYHEWSYFDEDALRWVSIGRFPISISGGRDGGYRGYSFNNRTFDGKWRIDVETKRGQVIGRMKINIESSEEIPKLFRRVY